MLAQAPVLCFAELDFWNIEIIQTRVEKCIQAINVLFAGAKIGGDGKILNDAQIGGSYDYMCFTNVGSRASTLTAYRTKHNGVRITTGCFFGDLVEFRKDIAKKSEDEALIKKEYELIADVIQHRFIDNNTADYTSKNNEYECC